LEEGLPPAGLRGAVDDTEHNADTRHNPVRIVLAIRMAIPPQRWSSCLNNRSGGIIHEQIDWTMVIATVVCPMALAQTPPAPDAANPVFMQLQDTKWQVYPGGTKVAILHVDPTSKTTELLIWNPPNTHVPRHWHSANEKISIIHGTFIMKHDDSEDKVALKPGGFAYMPPKMIHEAWTKPDTDALYFITVDGAWDHNPVESQTKASQ
jgi:uncharacterized RmlC-like cupin family protein